MKFLSKQDEETLSQIARWWRSNKNALDRVGVMAPRSRRTTAGKTYLFFTEGWGNTQLETSRPGTTAHANWGITTDIGEYESDGPLSVALSEYSVSPFDNVISGHATPHTFRTSKPIKGFIRVNYEAERDFVASGTDPDFGYRLPGEVRLKIFSSQNGPPPGAFTAHPTEYWRWPATAHPTSLSGFLPDGFVAGSVLYEIDWSPGYEYWLCHRVVHSSTLGDDFTVYIRSVKVFYWEISQGGSVSSSEILPA